MNRSTWRTILPLLLLVGCSSHSPERTGRTELAIRDGVLDSEHDGVVYIQQTDGHICSGYLITPDRVLTARHCVGDWNFQPKTACESIAVPVVLPRELLILWPSEITGPTDLGSYVRSIALPPASIECENDVAILRLPHPLTNKLIEPRLYLPAVVGERFTAIGYGLDGDKRESDSVRRQLGDLRVLHLGPWKRDNEYIVAIEGDWVADRGPCGGDSGSPALDVSGRSIGVMVRGRETVCETMGYNGLPKVADFIREEARASLEALAASGADVPRLAWLDPPAEASAKLGDDCWSETQCEAGLVCAPLRDRIRCTIPCDSCGEGTTCQEGEDGLRTCAPVVAPSKETTPTSPTSPTSLASSPMPKPKAAVGGCAFGNPASDVGRASAGLVLVLGAAFVGRRRRTQ